MRAPALHHLWLATLAASVVTMLFYRSSAPHGPDAVGFEVMAFGFLLMVAFGMSLVVYWDGPPPYSILFRRAPLVTVVVGIVEVFGYFAVILG